MFRKTSTLFIATISIYLVIAVLVSFKYDFTKKRIVGDEPSHLLQALSLANDLDLKYDHHDEESWQRIGWEKYPRGLIYQEYRHGYAFAKPYGYSLYLAPFYKLFGTSGIIFGNFIIYLLLSIFLFLTFKEKLSTANSIKLTLAFCLFSYVYLYIFFIHSDLFLGMLASAVVYCGVRYLKTYRYPYLFLVSAISGFLVSDKIVFVLVLAPLIAYLLYTSRSRLPASAVASGIFVVTFFVSIMPYLHYSDYKAWNPYSGDRYIAETSSPFFSAVDEIGKIHKLNTGRNFSRTKILESMFSVGALQDRMRAFVYYFIGSFTGMLVFIPMALITICASVFALHKRFNALLCVSLLSVLSYIFFYCWLFPYNYYGGGQSIGNRYFLQIFPLLALMVYANPCKTRFINVFTGGAFIISGAFLYHHHFNPSDAHIKVASSSWLQSFMPFEITQQWLSSEIGSRPVNGSLYPRTHNRRCLYYDVCFAVDGISYFANTKSVHTQAKWVSDIKDDQVLLAHSMNGKSFFVDSGFHGNENTHIWSKRNSRLFMKSNQGGIRMELVPLISGTVMDINATCNIEKLSDGVYSLYTDNESSEYIQIVFSANKSAVPCRHDKSSTDTDNRDLSFRLTLR